MKELSSRIDDSDNISEITLPTFNETNNNINIFDKCYHLLYIYFKYHVINDSDFNSLNYISIDNIYKSFYKVVEYKLDNLLYNWSIMLFDFLKNTKSFLLIKNFLKRRVIIALTDIFVKIVHIDFEVKYQKSFYDHFGKDINRMMKLVKFNVIFLLRQWSLQFLNEILLLNQCNKC